MNPETEQQTDERIEAVLAALREAQPRAGMEQRIHAAVLRAADAAGPAKPRMASLHWPQLGGAIAAVASLVLLSVHLHLQQANQPLHNRVIVISSQPSRQQAQVQAEHSPHSEMQRQPARPLHLGAAARSLNQPVGEQRPTLAAHTNEASQAAHATEREQGFPAPPLPLTEQERLLIRLVHRDDPVQLAQLTPAAREAELQRDQEQTREFFKPAPMLAANFKLEPYPVIGGSK